MKRKILFVAIVLAVAMVCLVACGGNAASLQQIQSLLKADYSEIILNVSTTTSDVTLNGNYTLTFDGNKTTVVYDFYRLNDLDVNGDNADSYLSREQGSVVV